jgi:hypothetical protein
LVSKALFEKTDTPNSGKPGLDGSEMPTSIGLSDTSNGCPRGNNGFFFKCFLTKTVEEGLQFIKGLFIQAFFLFRPF